MTALPEYQGFCAKDGKVHTKLCISYKNGGCVEGICPNHYLHLEYCEHSFRGDCAYGVECNKLHATHVAYQYWNVTGKDGEVYHVICPFKGTETDKTVKAVKAPVVKTVKAAPVAAKTVKPAVKDPKSFAAKAAGPAPAAEVKEPPKQNKLEVTFDITNESSAKKSLETFEKFLGDLLKTKTANFNESNLVDLVNADLGVTALLEGIAKLQNSFYNAVGELHQLNASQAALVEAARKIKLL